MMQEAWRNLLIPEAGYEIRDLWQVLVVLLVLLLSVRFVPANKSPGDRVYNCGIWFREQRGFIVFWVAVLVLHLGFELLTSVDTPVFQLFNYLGAAWFLIGFITSFIKNRFWAESWAAVFYLLIAYSILALAGPAIEFLDQISFSFGVFRLSAWQVLAGLTTVLFALWASLALSRLIEKQIERLPRMSGSLKVPIGISYKEDPHQCIALCLEAASSIERVLKDPAPGCLLKGFGDSSVDLELRFWIHDPSEGVSNIRSSVLLAVWDSFKANGVEIPFPQRDLHIRSSSVDFVSREHPDPG